MKSYWLFLRGNWPLLLFGFSCVFWGNFGQSFFIGLFGDEIKQSLGLSASQYGSTYSAATLLSALTMLWVGAFIDRWPLRRFVVFVAAGLCVACVVFALTHHLWLLALAFYGARLFGQGLLPHTGATTMARHFSEGRGKAISIAGTGVSVGEIVLPVIAVWALHSFGWQTSWLLIAAGVPVIFLPLAMLLLRRARWHDGHLDAHLSSGAKLSGRRALLTDRRYWFAAPTILSMPFMLTAVFIHQDFILSEKGWSAEWMASCFVLYGVVHWLSSVSSGILVDRFSGTRLLSFYTWPLLLALLAVANLSGTWVTPVMMMLLGIAIGAAGPVVNSVWAEIYGPAQIGGVRSASGSVMVLATAFSPVGYGWLIDAGVSLQMMFNASALFFMACLVLLRLSYRPA